MLAAHRARERAAHELDDARAVVLVGRERALLRRRLLAAPVLRDLHGGLAEDREAVVAGILHPDPDREAPGREGRRILRLEVDHLLARDDEVEPVTEQGEHVVRPGPCAHDELRGADLASVHLHAHLPAVVRDRLDAGALAQVGAVCAREALVRGVGPRGRRDAGPLLEQHLGRLVDAQLGKAPHRLGTVEPLVGHSTRVHRAAVGLAVEGIPRREDVNTAGLDHELGARLGGYLAPRGVRSLGQPHVRGIVVGEADDARVILRSAPVVAELEALQRRSRAHRCARASTPPRCRSHRARAR